MAPQTECRHEGGARQKPVSVLKHGISGTNRYVIQKLEAELRLRKAKYEEAERVNHELRAKEQVLLEKVATQGNTLHFVALAAFQDPDVADTVEATMAQSLLQDVKVHQLLSLVGSRCTPDDAEPYTTRCMRAACTPECVAAVRSMTLEDVVQRLRHKTMRLALLLQSSAADESEGEDNTMGDDGVCTAAPLLTYTVDSIVDEYTELAMLLHVASDKVNLQLGTINLDTMQPQEPPAGHWKHVLGHLQLQPEQISRVCIGFQMYTEKVTPLVAHTHEVVRYMHAITGAIPPELQRSIPVDSQGVNCGSANANINNNVHNAGGCSSSSTRTNSGHGPGSPSSMESAVAAAAAATCQTLDPSSRSSSADGLAAENSGGAVMLGAGGISSSQFTAAAAAFGGLNGITSTEAGKGSGLKPWQQLGLPEAGLTVEDAERLDELLKELLSNVMRLRELHRSVTFLWLNTLTKRQKAISIVKAYPFWTQPLAMCKILLEQQQQHQNTRVQQQQQQPVSQQHQASQQYVSQQLPQQQQQQQQGSMFGSAMDCSL